MDNIDHSHFAAIPWCAPHLEGDRVVAETPTNRTVKASTEDALFAETLNHERGIVRCLRAYELPVSPTERIESVKVFFTLGTAVNGYPGVCHGGLVAAMMDEVIGMLKPINELHGRMAAGVHMTAYLNTTFLQPVTTPTTILARSWFTKIKGRKFYQRGSIEDEKGVILARAEALSIQLKSSL